MYRWDNDSFCHLTLQSLRCSNVKWGCDAHVLGGCERENSHGQKAFVVSDTLASTLELRKLTRGSGAPSASPMDPGSMAVGRESDLWILGASPSVLPVELDRASEQPRIPMLQNRFPNGEGVTIPDTFPRHWQGFTRGSYTSAEPWQEGAGLDLPSTTELDCKQRLSVLQSNGCSEKHVVMLSLLASCTQFRICK